MPMPQINPNDPRMAQFTNRELHWKRCETARRMYLESGAELWIQMGRAAGCPWTVALQGAHLGAAGIEKPKPQIPALVVAATALVFSGVAFMAGRR